MTVRKRRKKAGYEISQCALYKVQGMRQLGGLLFHASNTLDKFAAQRSKLYREWDKETRPGKLRHIENPAPPLKEIQARIAKLLMRLSPPDFLFCPVKNRDFVLNALEHCDARAVFTIDVKEYFSSTPSNAVLEFFSGRMRCAGDVSALLMKLTTHNGHLPTGSPLSPILAYYANEPMWLEIRKFIERWDCRMSVYMDDLTVSGDRVPWSLRNGVVEILNRHGFYGHKATHFVGRPGIVTGVASGSGVATLPHHHYRRYRERLLMALSTKDEGERDKLAKSIAGMLRLRRHMERRRSKHLREKSAALPPSATSLSPSAK